MIGENWRYERHDDGPNTIDFTLYTVDVDADDEGRTKDFGSTLAEGWWHGEDAELWAATAAPTMLTALQMTRDFLARQVYDPPSPEHNTILTRIERAIQEATTDPNDGEF